VKPDDVIRGALPQFFPAHWLDRPGIVFTDFPSRIRVGYVVRGDGSYSYLCDEEFAALPITSEELHAAALENLARLPSAEIAIGKVPGGAEGWIRATEDNFAAARILLPEVQDVFRRELGEEFLVTLPHRDDCFCWSLAQTTERQQRHAADALSAFEQEEYNLTPDVLLCSRGGFRLHRQQAAAEPGPAADRAGLG
jgi:uncharacterized protein YtpQ (UPF0354 family)